MSEYVYMIREREFIRLNEHTYKIGKTAQEPNSRLAGYPKGSEILLFIKVDNCTDIENKIKEQFIKLFVQKKEYGTEYFCGDPNKMLSEFKRITDTKKCIGDNNNTKKFIQTLKLDHNKTLQKVVGEHEIKISNIEKHHEESLQKLELKIAKLTGKLERYVDMANKYKFDDFSKEHILSSNIHTEIECEYNLDMTFVFRFPGSKTEININPMCIDFDEDSDDGRDIGITNLTKETIKQFQGDFENKRQCKILFSNNYCWHSIQLCDGNVSFVISTERNCWHNATVNKVPYKVCKNAVMKCIDRHLEFYDEIESKNLTDFS